MRFNICRINGTEGDCKKFCHDCDDTPGFNEVPVVGGVDCVPTGVISQDYEGVSEVVELNNTIHL
jgi:hypothetical protein